MRGTVLLARRQKQGVERKAFPCLVDSLLLDWRVRKMERDIVEAATSTKKSLTTEHRWPNIIREEQSVIKRFREFDVRYNTA